ncbi:MAG: peptidoglycan-binding protein [Sneathiella sp.]
MTTELQKRSVQAIVNIFETGKTLGDYGKVTLLVGDSGHLTYGRSQTTLASGNLSLLINAYCSTPNAEGATALSKYKDRLEDMDLTLDHDTEFRNLLGKAGDDIVMQDVQDDFFDRIYWQPAVRSAEFIGSKTALGMAVVYDSRIHGSWHRIRDRTIENQGTLADLGEKAWMLQYISTRFDWLVNHSNALLKKTKYRMEALRDIGDAGNWDLKLPMTVRGNVIDGQILSGDVVRASAAISDERILRLRNPMMEGRDVKELQEALISNGFNVDLDGFFGPVTVKAVIEFQRSRKLIADGIVGQSTNSGLGLRL